MPPSSAPFPLLYAWWFADLTVAAAPILAALDPAASVPFHVYTPDFSAPFVIAEVYAYAS